MNDRLPLAHIDAMTARTIQSRNIRNSQAIIHGEFEVALADIIDQIEHPTDDKSEKPLAIPDLVRRIARALSLGLAGLHPNGFDFCLWMWEVAPLHGVNLRLRNHRTVNGIPLGVVYLRRITSLVLKMYINQHGEKVEMLYELLDSSACRMDAHDLMDHTMLGDIIENVEDSRSMLDAFASSKVPWRVLLAASAAEHIAERYPEKTEAVLSLITIAFHLVAHPAVQKGIRNALNAVARYGDEDMVEQYVALNLRNPQPPACTIICEELFLPRIRRDEQFRKRIAPLIDELRTVERKDECFRKALEALTEELSA
jgi:hypothetical protein